MTQHFQDLPPNIVGFKPMVELLGRVEEAEKSIPGALDIIRESGEKESLFLSLIGMCEYLVMKKEMEKAVKSYIAADAFKELVKYPLMGPSLHTYTEMVNLFTGMENDSEQK